MSGKEEFNYSEEKISAIVKKLCRPHQHNLALLPNGTLQLVSSPFVNAEMAKYGKIRGRVLGGPNAVIYDTGDELIVRSPVADIEMQIFINSIFNKAAQH
jgi:hypothetical protein